MIIIVIIIILFYLYKYFINKTNINKKDTKIKLVNAFTNLYPYSTLNLKNYNDAIQSTNQLVILQDMAHKGHQIPNQVIDIAEQLQRDIMNDIQSLIHSFHSTVIDNHKFEVHRNILQKILQEIVDDIKNIYKRRYNRIGPSIYNPPPSNREGPWKNPLDEENYSPNWNFYY